MGKEITLAELAANHKQTDIKSTSENITAKEMSVSDLAKNLPGREEQEEMKAPEVVSNGLQAMRDELQKRKDFIENEVMPVVEENARELAIENELKNVNEESESNDENEELEENDNFDIDDELYDTSNDEDDNIEPEVNIVVKTEEPKKSSKPKKENKTVTKEKSEDSMIDDLINELEDDEINALATGSADDEETIEETRERFKESLSEIKVTSDVIDLSSFKIRHKPVSCSTVLNNIESSKVVKKADWVLFHTKKSITMTECDGPELEALRKTIGNSNEINASIATLKFLYSHIDDHNKPGFETWCKLTRYEDLESLYYALYKACYGDVNLVGRQCSEDDGKNKGACGKVSIINTPIDDMVKFEDDETKEKFNEILSQDTTTYDTEIQSILMPISDDIAIAYHYPTLYSTFIQYATLKPNIREKYADLLNTMACIDSFFIIDKDTKELVPISIKQYPDNINKTVMEKLKAYAKILKTLNNDQYSIATTKLINISEESKISYILPETICPECGATISEEPVSMLEQLFTRAQLAGIKSL